MMMMMRTRHVGRSRVFTYRRSFLCTDSVIEHARNSDVVLTEHDLPDCELSTSSTPNCLVTEDDTGTGVLIALRDIKQGEIFTVAT